MARPALPRSEHREPSRPPQLPSSPIPRQSAQLIRWSGTDSALHSIDSVGRADSTAREHRASPVRLRLRLDGSAASGADDHRRPTVASTSIPEGWFDGLQICWTETSAYPPTVARWLRRLTLDVDGSVLPTGLQIVCRSHADPLTIPAAGLNQKKRNQEGAFRTWNPGAGSGAETNRFQR